MIASDDTFATSKAEKLPPGTVPGRVFLRVRELEGAVDFYQRVLGLQLLRRGADSALLGVGEDDTGTGLVVLIKSPRALPAARNPGLYHLAILLPDRTTLGSFLAHAVRTRAPLQGASDHTVSEAIYLTDPEGNGIEVYRDRPRTEWPHAEAGVRMTTGPLDGEGLLGAASTTTGPFRAPANTVMGHLHLRVSDVERAQRFHEDVIGFELTDGSFPSARFLAVGGYHHHIGLNSWSSAGQPPAPRGAAGLAWYELLVPDDASRAALEARLERGATAVEESAVTGHESRIYWDEDGIAVAVARS